MQSEETPLDRAEREAVEAQAQLERDLERVDKMGEDTPEGEKDDEVEK